MINLENLKCVDDKINISEYIKFLKDVKQNMQNPNWLGDFDSDDIEELINEGAKIWMYYLDDTKVCSIMGISMDLESIKELGIYLKYNKVLECGPIFVNPKFQGFGLGSSMLKTLDCYAKDNDYEYGLATVDPNNIASIKMFNNDGYNLLKKVNLPRGQRNVYIKKYK